MGRTAVKQNDLHEKWARAGAEARIKEIQHEMEEIFRAFPDLRIAVGAPATGRRQRKQFSAEGRAAISEGMRKWWAERKAQERKGSKATKADKG
jgi:hypothetical protein